MAQIQDTGGQEKGGKKRAKRGVPTIDMTPMVDLAFLLLTFFVMTSTFSKPKVMSLVYPAKPKVDDPKPTQEINNAVTFLLSDDRIFYYQDAFYLEGNPKGKPATQLEETDFSPQGVRKLLTDLNRFVLEKKAGYDQELKRGQIADSTYLRLVREAKSDNAALKVLIKTDDMATCKNFIDLIDELKIADIGVIAPVDITAEELKLVKAKTDK
ncbi:biopolymer transporter ExbD [Crocinitomicaceae bacterium CZZ-1]|uniref:Biopolymer transporter ExbD n=1 Tax=Taishania pollutisoli TaxID=2766479 RepID=A0A8J6P633_9FLAO|nr:biopolymer transporter ExbD [Taishania pollutisoli]MBC9812559.1 biopolymer transporter ExbD [Taishania pollutisoli]NGF74533.1 biopolymer transporter ExbD [Fluviicola sp. SGL-29]